MLIHITCKADCCDRKPVARGMCKKHWKRWRNGKDINEKTWCDKTTEDLFWEKVRKSKNNDECWEWLGSTGGTGDLIYGRAWDGERLVGAHRYSYELHNGQIPEGGDVRGMCVCHKCDNPLCVNPNHLFLGTHTDNMLDKVKKGRGTGSITHCKRNHEFTAENTYIDKSGFRHCRICHKLRERKRIEKLNALRKV